MQNTAKNSEILALYKGGLGYSEIATRFNISRQRVYQIIRNSAPENWSKVSAFIKVRDRNVCGNCRAYFREFSDLVVHHIDQDPTNNHAKNLISLCVLCHSRFHLTKNLDRIPEDAKLVKNAHARFVRTAEANTQFLKENSANPDKE